MRRSPSARIKLARLRHAVRAGERADYISFASFDELERYLTEVTEQVIAEEAARKRLGWGPAQTG